MGPRAFPLFGALFGFVRSRARVTDYDAMAAMFRLADFHGVGVIGSAIATAAAGRGFSAGPATGASSGARSRSARSPGARGRSGAASCSGPAGA